MTTSRNRSIALSLACVLALTLGAGPTWAEKPEWAGQGKGGKHAEGQGNKLDGKHDGKREGGKPAAQKSPEITVRIGAYFGEPQRTAAREYYGAQARGGKCPPGLAKKNNGCLPPGQAKKYTVGQPLARTVYWYPVPQPVIQPLPVAPVGYRYVRVGNDILLLSPESAIVVDVIAGLLG